MKIGLRSWSLVLTISLIAVPTIICGGLLYFYLKGELENRRMITFMNFEQLGHRFDRSIEDVPTFRTSGGALIFDRDPVALFLRSENWKVVAGEAPAGLVSKDISEENCDIQSLSGSLYLFCPVLIPESVYRSVKLSGAVYWSLWKMNEADLAIFRDVGPSRITLLDGRGRPIYQSDRSEAQADILKKPLVQEFIRTPLTKSGSAPYMEADTSIIGFAMHLRKSNLTLFAEAPASLIFEALWKPSTWFLAALFFGVAFLSLLGRFFVMSIRDQIQALALSFKDFAQGMEIPTQHRAQDFLQDFEPMVQAMNQGTLELKTKLEDARRGSQDSPAEDQNP